MPSQERPARKERRPHRGKLRGMDGSLQNTEEPAQPAGAEKQQNAQNATPGRPQQLPAGAIDQYADKEIDKDGITSVIQIEQIGRTKVQRFLGSQDQREREVVEIVIDGRPEAGNHEVVRRHVMQQSLQHCHMKQLILPGGSVENELAFREPAASPK